MVNTFLSQMKFALGCAIIKTRETLTIRLLMDMELMMGQMLHILLLLEFSPVPQVKNSPKVQ